MSKNYTRDEADHYCFRGEYHDNTRWKWRYEHDYASSFCRYPRTTNELRQLRGAEHDGDPLGRRRRFTIRACYDDPPVRRNYGKSWKDYTRRRYQWERG